jgi:acyl carrier protein
MDEKIITKIEILLALESRFNIEIRDEEVEFIETFNDLINLVAKKIEDNGT